MVVVAMVCYEVFFLPTSCRWQGVLLFGHVGTVSCFVGKKKKNTS